MKEKHLIKIFGGLAILIALFWSCSLEESVLDEASGEEFLEQEVDLNIAAPAYGWLVEIFHSDNTWGVLNVPTDEMIVPTRGANWSDNGLWIALHRHTWNDENPWINRFWEVLSRGAALTNTALFLYQERLENGDPQLINELIAEMRFLRTYYRFLKLDLFRQVPMRDENDQTFHVPPPVFGPDEAYEWLVNELEDIIPDLGDKNSITPGRVSKDAAYALLAKLHLNAEVYIGIPRWQECLDVCNLLIQSGNYSIGRNYFDLFSLENEINNPEAIFMIRQNESEPKGVLGISPATTLHYNHDLGFGKQTWNGYSVVEDFFNSWDLDGNPSNGVVTSDVRFKGENYKELTGTNLGFLVGPQFHPDGSPIEDGQLTNETGRFVQLQYTPRINLISNALDHEGVRVLKYEPDPNSQNLFMGRNAFLIFRFADIWLMKAEALFRLGNSEEALIMVNYLREIRNAPKLDILTMEGLLQERGLELYWEGWRRQDLVRFGKFTNSWAHKETSDSFREIFPIPSTALGINPGLRQNPGY